MASRDLAETAPPQGSTASWPHRPVSPDTSAKLRLIRFVCGKRILSEYFAKLAAYRLRRQCSDVSHVSLTLYQDVCLDQESRRRFIDEKRRERLEAKVRIVKQRAREEENEVMRRARLNGAVAQHSNPAKSHSLSAERAPLTHTSESHSISETTLPRAPQSFTEAFQRLSAKQQSDVLATLKTLGAVPQLSMCTKRCAEDCAPGEE